MNQQASRSAVAATIAALGTAALLIASCASAGAKGQAQEPTAKSRTQGGAELWAENCMLCHNMRSPSSYSDAEWTVAMQHMRLRANLTAEESRRILEFLEAAN